MSEGGELKAKWAGVSVEKVAKAFEIDPVAIVNGIQSGCLECRQGSTINGKQWTQVLPLQVEQMLNSNPMGRLHLDRIRSMKDLIAVRKELIFHKNKLEELQVRKVQIEVWLTHNPMPR